MFITMKTKKIHYNLPFGFFLFGKVLKFLGLLRNSFNFHEKYLPLALATLVKIKRLFENGLKNWSLSDRSSYVSAQITRLAPF